ncbi:hypothetical protein [Streptomyces bacillaris]|uniref:hypothetical protein n=1 Tax=Streptomyces bacillaris TaxID=68179 RepID=UPI0036F5622E
MAARRPPLRGRPESVVVREEQRVRRHGPARPVAAEPEPGNPRDFAYDLGVDLSGAPALS